MSAASRNADYVIECVARRATPDARIESLCAARDMLHGAWLMCVNIDPAAAARLYAVERDVQDRIDEYHARPLTHAEETPA